MNRLIPALAFLLLALPSVAAAEWALVRGSGPQATFESSARPPVTVQPASGMSTVQQGKMTVLLRDGRSISGTENGTVYYCLSAKDGAQLAVALADSGPGREWYPGILGTELEFTPILYSSGRDTYGSVTQRVFLRAIQLDPWMGAFDAKAMGWDDATLVSQYEWITSGNESKLLVEYREPWTGEFPIVDDKSLTSFVRRADSAFTAHFSDAAFPTAGIEPYAWGHEGISSRKLSRVLGVTVTNDY